MAYLLFTLELIITNRSNLHLYILMILIMISLAREDLDQTTIVLIRLHYRQRNHLQGADTKFSMVHF
jgi:hypothetical protein